MEGRPVKGGPEIGWIRGPDLWVRSGREAAGAVFVIRRTLGNAVVRNRLKRRLRHILRDLGAPASGSVVFLARPSAVRQSFPLLRQQVCQLLKDYREAIAGASVHPD